MNEAEFVYMAVIAAPREEVWKALTSPEFTRQYWHETAVVSDFRAGAPIEFVTPDGTNGVSGEVLVADFPAELSYTWLFASEAEAGNSTPSRVTFRLEALDVGTRLVVTHDRLETGSRTHEMVSFGWPHVICGLKTLLETGKAVDFTSPEEPGCPGEKAAASA